MRKVSRTNVEPERRRRTRVEEERASPCRWHDGLLLRLQNGAGGEMKGNVPGFLGLPLILHSFSGDPPCALAGNRRRCSKKQMTPGDNGNDVVG
jgi:hypothetical protein